uniref:Uncharacterized protein n=1 Tax=Octopus bimaculoides TaxID=37653 RepID=A0A0L8H685_OCTBM
MAALRVAGSLLKSSGWTTEIEEAGIAELLAQLSLSSLPLVQEKQEEYIRYSCSFYQLKKRAYEASDESRRFHANPSVNEDFAAGRFVIHKTERPFSAIGVDQAHEQNNALAKGDGRAVGITENESALIRRIVSGPEIYRLVGEYDEY